ncbi:MAG: hypothetical protein Q7V58_09525 [Actinomycetota bacterium]|nr:hypothetical protein [Actinomycetota bacterium]
MGMHTPTGPETTQGPPGGQVPSGHTHIVGTGSPEVFAPDAAGVIIRGHRNTGDAE